MSSNYLIAQIRLLDSQRKPENHVHRLLNAVHCLNMETCYYIDSRCVVVSEERLGGMSSVEKACFHVSSPKLVEEP